MRPIWKRRGVWAACAAIAIAGAGYAWKAKHKKPEMKAEPAKVSKGDLEIHFADSGELAPKNWVDIASKVSGRVTELLVEEGQRVSSGQRVAVIQPGRTETEKYLPFTVVSPIAGMVMRYQRPGNYNEESRISRLGDYVIGLLESTDPTRLMTIGDISKLVVKMKISEMDVLKLKDGMKVDVDIDAMPGTKFPARVTLISPQADRDQNNLKTFKVEVTLDKSDAKLRPGMTARVDGLLEAKRGVLKLPLAAAFEEPDGTYAYIDKGKKQKPERVKVTLGMRNDMEAEVVGGVAEGAELLTEKPAPEGS